MSNRLVTEGLNALREQFKRDPETNRLLKGPVAKKAREVRKSIKRSNYKGPEDFNQAMLYALDPSEYSEYNPNPRDTFSSDEGHVRPFKGMNKDKNYYMQAPYVGFPNLETGVDNNRSIYPGGPTIGPTEPFVKGEEGTLDYFKNLTKPRTSYDI